MRNVIRVVAVIAAAVGLWAPAAQAGLKEDCGQFKNSDLAIRACSELIRRNARDAWPFNERGNAYDFRGEYDRAIADYSEAIRLNPRSAVSHSNRGGTLIRKGDYDRAIADFNEAIRLD